jgi:hypothetical protein
MYPNFGSVWSSRRECPLRTGRILDWAEKSTRNSTTRFCKVLWSNHSEREATWEESALREKYPHLFETEVTS